MLSRHPRKLPHVSDADGAACAQEYEPEPAAETFPLFFHAQDYTISVRRSSLACNFIAFSCFRCSEFWSLGDVENFYNLLHNSETPNLPVAEATVKVILIYILVRMQKLEQPDRGL